MSERLKVGAIHPFPHDLTHTAKAEEELLYAEVIAGPQTRSRRKAARDDCSFLDSTLQYIRWCGYWTVQSSLI
jgi:hypothetical protein